MDSSKGHQRTQELQDFTQELQDITQGMQNLSQELQGSTQKPIDATKKTNLPRHPSYTKMIHEAFLHCETSRKNTLSRQVIETYLQKTYGLGYSKRSRTQLRKVLKECVRSGDLVQTSGEGFSGSFKLATKKQIKAKQQPKPTPSTRKVLRTKVDKSKVRLAWSLSALRGTPWVWVYLLYIYFFIQI